VEDAIAIEAILSRDGRYLIDFAVAKRLLRRSRCREVIAVISE
jgi:hypothetical protein